MDHSTAVSVALAIVSSRLDYVRKFHLIRQSAQAHSSPSARTARTVARVVLQQRSRARSTPLMQQLHWLPTEWRIRFNLDTGHLYSTTHRSSAISCRPFNTASHNSKVYSVHLPLSYFSFHVITYHLVHGLSASLPLNFGIPYLFTLGNHNHSPHSDAI